jgi:hypothetical protein
VCHPCPPPPPSPPPPRCFSPAAYDEVVLQVCGACAAGLTNYSTMYLNTSHKVLPPAFLPQARLMFTAKECPLVFTVVGQSNPVPVRSRAPSA